MYQANVVEEIKTQFFIRKSCRSTVNVSKYGTATQARVYNSAHALCILDK